MLARQQLATRRRAFTYLGVSLASAKVLPRCMLWTCVSSPATRYSAPCVYIPRCFSGVSKSGGSSPRPDVYRRHPGHPHAHISLPKDELAKLHDLLRATLNTASNTQCQLEYLLGKLSFATRVIVPGRALQIVVTCQLVPAAVLPDQALRRVPQIPSLMARAPGIGERPVLLPTS